MYNYVNNNPLNSIDPSGLACWGNKTTTTCKHPLSGRTISFPTPPGLNGEINQYGVNSAQYHAYDIQVSSFCYSDNDVRKAIINRPTPGISFAATRLGTENNATPQVMFTKDPLVYIGTALWPQNPVISYALSDGSVVNVTQPGHSLEWGYVHRVVENGVIHNYGEGNSVLQGNSMQKEIFIIPSLINNQWNSQSKNVLNDIRDKNTCSCKR